MLTSSPNGSSCWAKTRGQRAEGPNLSWYEVGFIPGHLMRAPFHVNLQGPFHPITPCFSTCRLSNQAGLCRSVCGLDLGDCGLGIGRNRVQLRSLQGTLSCWQRSSGPMMPPEIAIGCHWCSSKSSRCHPTLHIYIYISDPMFEISMINFCCYCLSCHSGKHTVNMEIGTATEQ